MGPGKIGLNRRWLECNSEQLEMGRRKLGFGCFRVREGGMRKMIEFVF